MIVNLSTLSNWIRGASLLLAVLLLGLFVWGGNQPDAAAKAH